MSPDTALRDDEAVLSQTVYWLLFNIPNGAVTLAQTVLPYKQPKEQAPGQRFAFFLFEQPFFMLPTYVQREHFDMRWFIYTTGLGNPVCVQWFTSP